MGFTLEKVVPWGRSFDEYVNMFGLTEVDLGLCILGCGDGPAAFNSALAKRSILLGWYVAFQSKAVQVVPFRLFFWSWINVTAPLRNSRALRALYASAAWGAGGCLGLLAQAASA